MDQVHVIRHKVLVEGRSARQVALEMGVIDDNYFCRLNDNYFCRRIAPSDLLPSPRRCLMPFVTHGREEERCGR